MQVANYEGTYPNINTDYETCHSFSTTTKSRYGIEWIDKYLENWKGYNQEVCFDLNVLIIDSKNIVWGRDIPELFKFLKTQHGIESHVCNLRHSLYWEGGVICSIYLQICTVILCICIGKVA